MKCFCGLVVRSWGDSYAAEVLLLACKSSGMDGGDWVSGSSGLKRLAGKALSSLDAAVSKSEVAVAGAAGSGSHSPAYCGGCGWMLSRLEAACMQRSVPLSLPAGFVTFQRPPM